ncbi:Corrinoid adenosyltransferase [Bacillus sp. CECT 9360]|nr:Corrinoid adenosyltransferase [Bacillus sp. CECT 9360]
MIRGQPHSIRTARFEDRQAGEAYGTCDEANSMIGLALSHLNNESFSGKESILEVFHKVQTALFHVGAELATPGGKEVKWKLEKRDVAFMEATLMHGYPASLPPLTNFVLPGGHPAGAAFHAARTIVRRAERCALTLEESTEPLVLAYLNRLSDLLFVTARLVNHQLGRQEPTLHQE